MGLANASGLAVSGTAVAVITILLVVMKTYLPLMAHMVMVMLSILVVVRAPVPTALIAVLRILEATAAQASRVATAAVILAAA